MKVQNIKELGKELNISTKSLIKAIERIEKRDCTKYMAIIEGETYIQETTYNKIINLFKTINNKIQPLSVVISEAKEYIPIKKSTYVYFLINDRRLIYIGQTDSLTGRINEHQKTKDFNKVYCIEVDSKYNNTIEKINIYHHKPSINIVIDDELSITNEVLKYY